MVICLQIPAVFRNLTSGSALGNGVDAFLLDALYVIMA
jgi:hypothetical protein